MHRPETHVHATSSYPTRLAEPAEPIRRREPVLHHPDGARAPGPLSEHELRRFERDGFLTLEKVFSEDEVAAVLAELEAWRTDPALIDRPGVIREPDSDVIRSLFAVHRISERFASLARDPRLADAARQILGSEVCIHQSRLNWKPAFTGRGFDWHSDFETWHAEDGMPRMRCVSMSINLTRNDEHNGPLLLMPGSHHWFLPTVGPTPDRYWETSLRRQKQGVPSPVQLARIAEQGGIRSVPAEPGSVTLFECNTLHGSADNLSPRPRSNLFFVYNSVDNAPEAPFAAREPRPEWLGERNPAPLAHS